MKFRIHYPAILLFLLFFNTECRQPAAPGETEISLSPLEKYVADRDMEAEWKVMDTLSKQGYTTYVIRFVSQKWLTEKEVKDPIWWHWLTVVVPENLDNNTGLLFISGGSRNNEQPESAGEPFIQTALASNTIVAELHNVPNQPLEFVGDTFGPRKEDDLIAFGWRKFLEGGARDEDIRWLARLPMTRAAVRAMDIVELFSINSLDKSVNRFVVAGASKRGWTTWTTGMADDRVVAIVPIVIDLLHVEPSFQHHWRAYGKWAAAVNGYQREGIMDWQGSQEYRRLVKLTEPYSFKDKLTLPKLIVNATGDQFFLPDSWQFYWKDLPGEKHLRYVPNSEHSMRETDAWTSVLSFYEMIVENSPRPDFNWSVVNDTIHIETLPDFQPDSITLWQAHNPYSRNFQVDSIGRAYQPLDIPVNAKGLYNINIPKPTEGWKAYFVELTFPFKKDLPLKLSTGVTVTPDEYPFTEFVSENAQGNQVR